MYFKSVIVYIARKRTPRLPLPNLTFWNTVLHGFTFFVDSALAGPRTKLIHMFGGPFGSHYVKLCRKNGDSLKLCFMSWREGFPTERREETSNCCWLQHARDNSASTKVQMSTFSCEAHSDFRVSDLFETLEVELFWSTSPKPWAINSFHAFEQKYKRWNILSPY